MEWVCHMETPLAGRGPVTHGVEFGDKLCLAHGVVFGNLRHEPRWALAANLRILAHPIEMVKQAFPNISPTNVNPAIGVTNPVHSMLVGCQRLNAIAPKRSRVLLWERHQQSPPLMCAILGYVKAVKAGPDKGRPRPSTLPGSRSTRSWPIPYSSVGEGNPFETIPKRRHPHTARHQNEVPVHAQV